MPIIGESRHQESTQLLDKAIQQYLGKLCTGWRQTSQCNPQGTRERRHDRDCNTGITTGSGYCECGDGEIDFKVEKDCHDWGGRTCLEKCSNYNVITDQDTKPLKTPLQRKRKHYQQLDRIVRIVTQGLEWELSVLGQLRDLGAEATKGLLDRDVTERRRLLPQLHQVSKQLANTPETTNSPYGSQYNILGLEHLYLPDSGLDNQHILMSCQGSLFHDIISEVGRVAWLQSNLGPYSEGGAEVIAKLQEKAVETTKPDEVSDCTSEGTSQSAGAGFALHAVGLTGLTWKLFQRMRGKLDHKIKQSEKSCCGWKQTSECDPTSNRTRLYDRSCDSPIGNNPGYCLYRQDGKYTKLPKGCEDWGKLNCNALSSKESDLKRLRETEQDRALRFTLDWICIAERECTRLNNFRLRISKILDQSWSSISEEFRDTKLISNHPDTGNSKLEFKKQLSDIFARSFTRIYIGGAIPSFLNMAETKDGQKRYNSRERDAYVNGFQNSNPEYGYFHDWKKYFNVASAMTDLYTVVRIFEKFQDKGDQLGRRCNNHDYMDNIVIYGGDAHIQMVQECLTQMVAEPTFTLGERRGVINQEMCLDITPPRQFL